MQQFPDRDQSLIEELIWLSYTEQEIKTILNVLRLNANNAGFGTGNPKRTRFINAALNALIQRFTDALDSGQCDALLEVGYIPEEIRESVFTNLLPMTQLLTKTKQAQASGECERLDQLGYTDIQIRSFIRAGFIITQLKALADRVNDAQINGRDAQGLTVEQINDMLFKDRSINGKRTLGIVTALLSGIASNTREGEVARCIIEYATMFDVPYGPGGASGQIDVGTQHVIVEAKVDSVRSDQLGQYIKDMNNDVMNPPDANGMRKTIILYAPGYRSAATASITDPPPKGVGGYVSKSCEQLREEIQQLGGP